MSQNHGIVWWAHNSSAHSQIIHTRLIKARTQWNVCFECGFLALNILQINSKWISGFWNECVDIKIQLRFYVYNLHIIMCASFQSNRLVWIWMQHHQITKTVHLIENEVHQKQHGTTHDRTIWFSRTCFVFAVRLKWALTTQAKCSTLMVMSSLKTDINTDTPTTKSRKPECTRKRVEREGVEKLQLYSKVLLKVIANNRNYRKRKGNLQ